MMIGKHMVIKETARIAVFSLLLFLCESSMIFYYRSIIYLVVGVTFFVALNIIQDTGKHINFSYRICSGGADLLTAFIVNICMQSAVVISHAVIYGWFNKRFWMAVLIYTILDIIVFWNGIIRVYITSPVVGLKWRVIGILCGFIPVANIIVLCIIISLVRFDIAAEKERYQRNMLRKNDSVCAAKYPILLIHGVFFRDTRYLNYWGRIPDELIKNGASVYYGEQQSALGVKESASEIADTILRIVNATGCHKVNIIAHSKGGLDARYAITHLGMSDFVASLTTVNTPHHGCAFADWVLGKTGEKTRKAISTQYNKTLMRLGDKNPDFISAVSDLTAASCEELNLNTPDVKGVFYQSTGSKINSPFSNIFPLCLTSSFVNFFDGENDGLVSVNSAKWGENFIYISTNSAEGISHADMIDMSRHNRRDFDVCEFYVGLVNNLKERGL